MLLLHQHQLSNGYVAAQAFVVERPTGQEREIQICSDAFPKTQCLDVWYIYHYLPTFTIESNQM